MEVLTIRPRSQQPGNYRLPRIPRIVPVLIIRTSFDKGRGIIVLMMQK